MFCRTVFFFYLSVLLVTQFGCWKTPRCDGLKDNEVVECLNSFPNEDITKIPKVAEHLKKHDNYISLTSSPKRVKELIKVFDSLDLQHIKNILLVLPEKFGRDNSEYVIPPEIESYKKVRIIRPEKDLGPITKLVPALEYVGAKDPDSIVITVDDDTGYFKGTINQLLKHAILDDAVVGASAQNLAFWGISNQLWPESADETKRCGRKSGTACDVIEGFGGVAYKPKYFDTQLLRKYSDKEFSRACFSSDDFVISYFLAKEGIKRKRIFNDYITIPHQFEYGFQEDALHKGAGFTEVNLQNINRKKYQKCAEDIAKEMP